MHDGTQLAEKNTNIDLDRRPSESPPRIVQPKILIADDSVTIRATLKRALNNEFLAVDAKNGLQAWDILQEDPGIELVVTDLSMPELDGYGLIKKIRSYETSRFKNMPIIVVTGADDTEARERAFIEGANDFITKTSDHVEFLARVRAHYKLAQTIRELEESRGFLREQANTDSLTKLANRRFFFQSATSSIAQMHRQNEHFSMIMLDIDHFKRINDTYGHQAGDYVLVELAKVLTSMVREGDIVGRMGGEEFMVACPYTNRLAAIVLSERLRKSVESSEFYFESNSMPVTISLGVAAKTSGADDIDKLIAVADSRLYIAKQKGRNRICASDKSSRNDRLIDMDMVCPKLDEALTMIRHGNTFRLLPHLAELGEQLMPLLELINEEKFEPQIDLDQIRNAIEALKS
ncbi:MAG: diguanylate cyclase [Thiohalomonadales bacterium]